MNSPWESHLLGADARGRARSIGVSSGQKSAPENVIDWLKCLAYQRRQLRDIHRNPPGLHREKRRKSSAGCFVKRSAKLFGKGARRRQIEKAPAVINLPVSERSTSKSQRGVVQLVKTDNLTVQFDIQSIRGDGHLDNIGVFRLVGGRLTGASK